MQSDLDAMKMIEPGEQEACVFSICTLVTRPEEYRHMVDTFRAAGFTEPDCEYLYIDNSETNHFDAYQGLNRFLQTAQGRWIILCHQDVELVFDDRAVLEKRLAELEALDSCWAIAGNAGASAPGKKHIHITDPNSPDLRLGELPHRVTGLDENFVVVKKAANLALSRDLEGFHLYATELCLVAELLGWHAWAVDFHLKHNSAGNFSRQGNGITYYQGVENLVAKYRRALSGRWVATVQSHFYVSGGWLSRLLNQRTIKRLVTRWVKLCQR